MENEIKEPALKYNYYKEKEYLQIERALQQKYKLHFGCIASMAGTFHIITDRK